MAHITYNEHPQLRNPILLVSFEGWNDASEVATWTARFLVRQWAAPKLAEMDPEDFYVFTETRPQVRISGENQRVIDWPSNAFYYHQDPQGDRDYVVLVGIEPNLKWNTFVDSMMEVIQKAGVSVVLTLGGLLAPVAHTQPPRLTGTATDPDLLDHLQETGVTTSRYEGPTGIVGVLNSALHKAGIPTASLWGNVPHYLSARPNIKVSLSMLRQLNRVFHLDMDLRRVERQASRFEAQVNEAVAGNSEITAYVQKLEAAIGRSGEEDITPPSELPSGETVVRELEEYLRRKQEEEPEENNQP